MNTKQVITLNPTCGTHIERAAQDAIELAAKYDRKVRLRFNGITVKVNRRLSRRHVVNQWTHMMDARAIRYRRSPEARAARAKHASDVELNQRTIDMLLENTPATKLDAMPWIAMYVKAADLSGVKTYRDDALAMLKGLGFVANEHVGDQRFENGTWNKIVFAEYIGGQAVSMLDQLGMIHPMLATWAKQCSELD